MGSKDWERRTPVPAKPFLWCLAEGLQGWRRLLPLEAHGSLHWTQALRSLPAEISPL